MPNERNPLWGASRSTERDTAGSNRPDENPLQTEPGRALTPEVLPPEQFDLAVMRADLERVATSSSLVIQYITTAKAKYRTAKQLELLDLLLSAVTKKTAFVTAQTSLAQAEEQQYEFGVLKQLRTDLKRVEMEAKLAEANLRKARAERDLQQMVTKEPKESAESYRQRIMLEVRALEAEMDRHLTQITTGREYDSLSPDEQGRYDRLQQTYRDFITKKYEALDRTG
jgi:hypothetical protein